MLRIAERLGEFVGIYREVVVLGGLDHLKILDAETFRRQIAAEFGADDEARLARSIFSSPSASLLLPS